MVVDVNTITWRFGHIISCRISIYALLSSCDRAKHPRADVATKFSNLSNVKITEYYSPSSDPA